jgi:uncharacterized membrane protein YdcZ (DUF606 family)
LGACILVGLTLVAPRLGPTQTFLAYFFVILATSALIDGFGVFGTDAKPLAARQALCRRRDRAQSGRPIATTPSGGAHL